MKGSWSALSAYYCNVYKSNSKHKGVGVGDLGYEGLCPTVRLAATKTAWRNFRSDFPTKSGTSNFKHVSWLDSPQGSPTVRRAPGDVPSVPPAFCQGTDRRGFKEELPPLLGAKMATVPGGTARSSQRATSLSQPPLRCDDGKQEGGGADDLGRSRAQRPPARAPAPPRAPASRQGALAGPGGARCLPGYSARPASPPGLRRGREIRVFSKMVALGSG